MVLFGMEYDLQLNKLKVGLEYTIKIDLSVLQKTLDATNARQTNPQNHLH